MEEILRRIEGLIGELIRTVRQLTLARRDAPDEGRPEQRQVMTGSVVVTNLQNPHPVSGSVVVTNLQNPHPVQVVNEQAGLEVRLIEVTHGCDYLLVPGVAGKRVRVRGLMVSVERWMAGGVRWSLRSGGVSITPVLSVAVGSPIVWTPALFYALGELGQSITFHDLDATCDPPIEYLEPIEVQILYDWV